MAKLILQTSQNEAEKLGVMKAFDLFANTAKELLKDLDHLLTQIEKEAPNYAPNRN